MTVEPSNQVRVRLKVRSLDLCRVAVRARVQFLEPPDSVTPLQRLPCQPLPPRSRPFHPTRTPSLRLTGYPAEQRPGPPRLQTALIQPPIHLAIRSAHALQLQWRCQRRVAVQQGAITHWHR